MYEISRSIHFYILCKQKCKILNAWETENGIILRKMITLIYVTWLVNKKNQSRVKDNSSHRDIKRIPGYPYALYESPFKPVLKLQQHLSSNRQELWIYKVKNTC
jgi:hypothetical protein